MRLLERVSIAGSARLFVLGILITASLSPFSVQAKPGIVLAAFAQGSYSVCNQNGREACAPPLPSRCVTGFYDQNLHGWYSFQNNCGQAISLYYVPLSGSSGGGQMDLGAGRHDSTGHDRSEISSMGGGYAVYVCPARHSPITDDNETPTVPNQRFTCRPSGI